MNKDIVRKYMTSYGSGGSMASQIVTAVYILYSKWYNDGDVFDNTYHIEGWVNDISSFANWLYDYANVKELDEIAFVITDEDYSELINKICDHCLTESFLAPYVNKPPIDDIYTATGHFKFVETEEEDE